MDIRPNGASHHCVLGIRKEIAGLHAQMEALRPVDDPPCLVPASASLARLPHPPTTAFQAPHLAHVGVDRRVPSVPQQHHSRGGGGGRAEVAKTAAAEKQRGYASGLMESKGKKLNQGLSAAQRSGAEVSTTPGGPLKGPGRQVGFPSHARRKRPRPFLPPAQTTEREGGKPLRQRLGSAGIDKENAVKGMLS